MFLILYFRNLSYRKLRIKRTIRVPALSNKQADIPPDDYPWRKYGQKPIKGSPHPRYLHVSFLSVFYLNILLCYQRISLIQDCALWSLYLFFPPPFRIKLMNFSFDHKFFSRLKPFHFPRLNSDESFHFPICTASDYIAVGLMKHRLSINDTLDD